MKGLSFFELVRVRYGTTIGLSACGLVRVDQGVLCLCLGCQSVLWAGPAAVCEFIHTLTTQKTYIHTYIYTYLCHTQHIQIYAPLPHTVHQFIHTLSTHIKYMHTFICTSVCHKQHLPLHIHVPGTIHLLGTHCCISQ